MRENSIRVIIKYQEMIKLICNFFFLFRMTKVLQFVLGYISQDIRVWVIVLQVVLPGISIWFSFSCISEVGTKVISLGSFVLPAKLMESGQFLVTLLLYDSVSNVTLHLIVSIAFRGFVFLQLQPVDAEHFHLL